MKKAVELFAGIGGFRIACDRMGLTTVWANDFSDVSCEVYRSRFGAKELVQGDINSLIDLVPDHDILTAGFPCQPFSSAGKKLGINDPRGTLFQVIVDILRAKRPEVFLLENVKRLLTMDRGRHFASILNALSSLDYQIEWRLINAIDVGLPQNRQRVFISGMKNSPRKTSDKSVGLTVRFASREELVESEKINCSILTSRSDWTDFTKHQQRFPAWGVAHNGKFYGVDLGSLPDAKRPTKLVNVLQTASQVGTEFDFTDSTQHRLKESLAVNRYVGGVEILSNQGGGARMGYTVFGVNGVAPTLTSSQSRHYERYKIKGRYRRLTNVEYARLQGFPDDHCSVVSAYNQYALYGNAVPPPMAEWALRRLLGKGFEANTLAGTTKQPDLFASL